MPTAFEEIMAVRGRAMPEHGEVTIVGTDPVLATLGPRRAPGTNVLYVSLG